ncbi:hypothetical protein ACQPWY_24085 [Pseudonocardia xinjiangensis]|uniref:hypothetical protein n=1 Tax=Pseudonocardia xinjiangensis TaxID=75289 RepID=UPI003D8CABE0
MTYLVERDGRDAGTVDEPAELFGDRVGVDGAAVGPAEEQTGAFGLAPHKLDSWKLSKDPLFVDKVRDVVGLYLDPPERALVLCVDAASSASPDARSRPGDGPRPAVPSAGIRSTAESRSGQAARPPTP